MRLINTQTLHLEEFFESHHPRYTTLSHTWGQDEVNLQDWEKWQEGDANTRARIEAKRGFQKIKAACKIARQISPESESGEYLWVDTNCIDKKSSAELSEAINSMFSWYNRAACCIVYLKDVGAGPDMVPLPKSRWFTRGWTLQELIAPSSPGIVHFYNGAWEPIGNRKSLSEALSSITGIDQEVLLEEDMVSGGQDPDESRMPHY